MRSFEHNENSNCQTKGIEPCKSDYLFQRPPLPSGAIAKPKCKSISEYVNDPKET